MTNRRKSRLRRLAPAFLAIIALAALVWAASAYLNPDLRKSIVFSGFGLC